MITTFDHKGPLRVATHKDLEIFTLAGWKLVAMYQENSLSTFMEPVQDEEPAGHDSYSTINCTRHRPNQSGHTQTFFILAQDEESAVAELSDKLELLRIERGEINNKLNQLQSSLRDRELDAKDAQDQLKLRCAEIERCHKSERANQESLRKMERDLARLRTQFGEKAVNEALSDA